MSVRTRSNMISTINAILTSNGVGDISGADINSICKDLADSSLFPEDTTSILSCDATISTAEILTGNATPVGLVAAPGAGKIIFIIGNILIKYIYAGAAFATNTDIDILHGSAVTSQLSGSPLANTANYYGVVTTTYGGLGSDVENKAINFKVRTGNPTGGGTSTVKVSFKYVILTL